MPRRRILSDARAEEAWRRWRLYRDNRPKLVAAELGISETTFYKYVRLIEDRREEAGWTRPSTSQY